MNKFDLIAILKQAEAATPGPWLAVPIKEVAVAGNLMVTWRVIASTKRGVMKQIREEADAEFAAAARTDVPMLVAALQEAQGRYADGTGTCYCDTVGETPCAYCQIITLERQLAEAQEKLNAVDKEIHTVVDLNKKTCEHAVCGLARRVARILKEEE